MSELMEENPEDSWKNFETPPIAIFQAGIDKASEGQNCMNVIKFYEKIPTKDKQLYFYEKGWPLLLFEDEYFEMEKSIVEWLQKRS